MSIKQDDGFQKIGDVFSKAKLVKPVKPPAHPWQELALRIIKELSVPGNKRNSVFMVCKKYPKAFIEMSLNDTKELCKTGEAWKYFFKIIAGK